MAPLQDSGVLERPVAASPSPREAWLRERLDMQAELRRTGRVRGRRRIDWWDHLLLAGLKWGLALAGLHRRGVRNAQDLVLRELDLHFAHLPQAFDGFAILHLSDLHLDAQPGMARRILDVWGGRPVDLCVLTGDYREGFFGPSFAAMAGMKILAGRIRPRHGILGVLGNHDDGRMVTPMEAMGIRMLINESVRIRRGRDCLRVVGTDDVRTYCTERAVAALADLPPEEFSIAMIHSPELYDAACALGVDLYLCGHTHGGQVCLPGGRAVVKHLDRGRAFYRGHWSYCGMQGVTHCGVGTSGPPVRFNSRGEILILRLHSRRA